MNEETTVNEAAEEVIVQVPSSSSNPTITDSSEEVLVDNAPFSTSENLPQVIDTTHEVPNKIIPVLGEVRPANAQTIETVQIPKPADKALINAAAQAAGTGNELMWLITVLVLAGFVGYYVILKVTPALHSPLMSVSNAISGIVIIGALITCGATLLDASKWLGFFAIILTAINVFGGFIITHRMLAMFRKEK